MPKKTKEEQREYARKHYQANKEAYRLRDQQRKQRSRDWVQSYKEEHGCNRCGENHVACLHFHHRDSKLKDSSIATMVSNRACIDALKREIAKCELVCANCHAKIHWDENKD